MKLAVRVENALPPLESRAAARRFRDRHRVRAEHPAFEAGPRRPRRGSSAARRPFGTRRARWPRRRSPRSWRAGPRRGPRPPPARRSAVRRPPSARTWTRPRRTRRRETRCRRRSSGASAPRAAGPRRRGRALVADRGASRARGPWRSDAANSRAAAGDGQARQMLRKPSGFVCDDGRCVVLTPPGTIRSNARDGLGAARAGPKVAPLRARARAAGRGAARRGRRRTSGPSKCVQCHDHERQAAKWQKEEPLALKGKAHFADAEAARRAEGGRLREGASASPTRTTSRARA